MKKLKHILLIDDDEISSWLNKTILQRMQVAEEISIIGDGEAALSYLKSVCGLVKENLPQDCPDLILLDLNMPNVDGFEVLKRLKQEAISSWLLEERIVVLTTSISKIDFEKAQSFQINNYLIKPISEAKIKQVLNKLSADKNKVGTANCSRPGSKKVNTEKNGASAERQASEGADSKNSQ